MQKNTSNHTASQSGRSRRIIVLELWVNNHPGVMSHVCGLFSRRAYNLEKILCFPGKDRQQSRMWLQVDEEDKLDQIVKQLRKLADVREVSYYPDGPGLFDGIERMMGV